jgi:1-acyl-sn-glycerol-3-phosphate acyltransferase
MNKLKSLPIIGTFIKKLDKDMENNNIQTVLKNAVLRSHSKYEIKGLDEQTTDILKNKKVVVVANHPHNAEVLFVMSALPDRKDSYLIIDNRYTGISEKLDKHFIPVYVSHYDKPQKHYPFLEKLVSKYFTIKTFSVEEERKRNIESIKNAADLLQKGGQIVIFPTGGNATIHDRWFAGIGKILKQAGQDEIYIAPMYVSGTSNNDLLRLLPFVGVFMPKISITVGKPYKIDSERDEDPVVMTKKIENKYKEWVKFI